MERRETLILWGKESRFLVATNQSKIKLKRKQKGRKRQVNMLPPARFLRVIRTIRIRIIALITSPVLI